jgi:hypothetical protein
MVPSREPGRETGMESWVTEPRKGTCLDVFHPDFQERPEERISIDAAGCIKVGRKIAGTQTGAICAEKHHFLKQRIERKQQAPEDASHITCCSAFLLLPPLL